MRVLLDAECLLGRDRSEPGICKHASFNVIAVRTSTRRKSRTAGVEHSILSRADAPVGVVRSSKRNVVRRVRLESEHLSSMT